MYVVESKGGAIACMLLSLLLLGTWPAILTLLERRGRLPQHTYLDYTITNLLAALIIAFTFGEIGTSSIDKPNFINQLAQDNWPSVLFAMTGGIALSLGNLATQYAWAFVGLSVTEVITSSITVVIGTTLNYFLDDKINKAEILFPGVGCFLIAVCFGSAVHSSNAADNKAKLTSFSNDYEDGSLNLENGTPTKEKAKFGTADFLIELENKRAIKVLGKGTFIGLAITFFAGVCFSLFSPAFNLATNDQWHKLKDGVPHLSVYAAFFYFSVSCFLIAIILNISFLYRPVLNLPKSSLKAYVSDWNGRRWAFLAGLLCGFGNGLQFMGGQAAGYAAADAVQALPLVSTFWGVLLFGEYRRSSRRTYVLLVGMLSMFIVAVSVLMASSVRNQTTLTTIPKKLTSQLKNPILEQSSKIPIVKLLRHWNGSHSTLAPDRTSFSMSCQQLVNVYLLASHNLKSVHPSLVFALDTLFNGILELQSPMVRQHNYPVFAWVKSNHPIRFPFGSGFGCGHPDFSRYINCSSGILQFSTGTGTYTISSIDYASNTLVIADPLMSTCSSMQNSGSFTLDRGSPFSIMPDNIFVLVGCSTTSPVFDRNADFCDTGSGLNVCRGLYSCKGVTGIGLEPNAPISTCCVYDPAMSLGSGYGLNLPKLQCSSYSAIYGFGGSEGDPMKWEYGISLQYNGSYYSNSCKNCEDSGGVCGFSGSDESFACKCRNGVNTTINCYGRGYGWSGTSRHKIQTPLTIGGFLLSWMVVAFL
ncbi:UNVERIFIED_CONTAM: Ureide permease 2 [Sesamum calycinum]|uniref:Ureide permease 2 n=1 Tax=Sesamum calycinum TaxID=2727403 RepID=A0AAW2QX12_9LAMI